MKEEIAIVLYMPALHKGYLDLIKKDDRNIDTIFLISETLVKETDEELAWMFEKDLRAVSATEMQLALSALQLASSVKILDEHNLVGFNLVIIPDNDDLVEKIVSKLYPLIVPQKEKWFIRWGKKTVLSQRAPVPTASISTTELDQEIMMKAFSFAEKSSDWWRQVGVIIFPLHGQPITGFNQHVPHPQAPYINGDPRTNFKPGEYIELSTAGHAEPTVIGFASRKGIVLDGASIYVTTLPCPACAWLIMSCGFKKVYYCEGYSQMGSIETFQNAGIEVIFVDVPK